VLRSYKYNLKYTPGLRQPYAPREVLENVLSTTQKLLFARKRILFYPEYPSPMSVPFKICPLLGHTMTNDPSQSFDAVFWWDDTTFPKRDPVLDRLIKHYDVINARCTDISKTHVEQVFSKVFGYSSTVDPRSYHGRCVKKSIYNSIHKDQSTVINCPVESIESDVIYQRLIDNRVDGAEVAEDIRVPIFKDSIPFIYLKHRPLDARFAELTSSILVEVDDVLSPKEQDLILTFCDEFGLDYGELDVLRDNASSKIYIVDANKTPANTNTEPSLSEADRRKALQRLATSFHDAFIN